MQLLQQLHRLVMMQQQCQLQKRLERVQYKQIQQVWLWSQTVQPLRVACRVKHGLNSQRAAQQEALRTVHLLAVIQVCQRVWCIKQQCRQQLDSSIRGSERHG